VQEKKDRKKKHTLLASFLSPNPHVTIKSRYCFPRSDGVTHSASFIRVQTVAIFGLDFSSYLMID